MKSLRRLFSAFLLMLTSCSVSRLVAQQHEQATLEVQLGHSFLVDAVAFSTDGKYAVTGAQDGRIILWEVATGAQLRQRFFSDVISLPITSVAISPGNEAIVAGTLTGEILVSEMKTGKSLGILKSPSARTANPINSIAFSSGGRLIFAGEESGVTRVWNSATQESLELPGHSSAVTAVALTPDNQLIGTASKDHTAILSELGTGMVRHTLTGHTADVLTIAFSRDGRLVMTGSTDRTVRLWYASSGKHLRTFTASSSVKRVVFSKDGKRIYAQTDDAIIAWDTLSGSQAFKIAQLEDHEPAMAISPDGNLLLTSGGAALGNGAVLWDASSGKRIRELGGGAAPVFAAKFSADGRYLATGSQDGSATLWDIHEGRQAFLVQDGHKPTLSVDIAIDGSFLLTGGRDGAVASWSTDTGQLLRTFRQPDGEGINSVAIAANTKEILAGGKDGIARLWNLDPKYKPLELKAGAGEVSAVAFSPKNDFVLTGGDDKILRQWVAGKTEPALLKGHNHPIKAITISPDAHFAISTDSDECLLWNLESATNMSRIPATDGGSFSSVAFSPDQIQFVVGAGNAALIWNQLAKKSTVLVGHEYSVWSVGFSPDSSFVVTASADGTTRIWDVATGKEVATLVTVRGGGWIIVDPSGRFDTNLLDGEAPLHWIVDSEPMRPLPLEIFMRDYYTPGLLSLLMNRKQLPELPSIAAIRNRVQPDVSIISVAQAARPGQVDVTVHAESHLDENKRASGLQDLRLFRDGQLVGSGYVDATAACVENGTQTGRTRGGYIRGALKNCDFTFHDVQLRSHEETVTFTAYAFNSERIKSATASLVYEPKQGGTATALRPKAYLLQIGVNHYAASRCELNYSVADAEKLSAELIERLTAQGYDVQPEKLESAGTGDVTAAGRAAIRDHIAMIASHATPDDVFFMSFSGHGYSTLDGQFYILPSDVQGSCRAVSDALIKSAISADELAEWLRPIDAGEMTLILDACFSAESVQSGDFKAGPLGSRGLGQLAYDKRMRVLAASQSDEVAHEFGLIHQGLLTYVLTHDGLDEDKADWKPRDGKIMVGEWLSYAANAVPKFVQNESTPANTKAAGNRFPESSANGSLQIPALFDFSKADGLRLQ